MTRVFLALTLCLSFTLPVSAQEEEEAQSLTAQPVDEAEEDADFAAFREALLAAVVARDIEAILGMAAEDVELSFGGAEGQEALRAYLEVDPEDFSPERRFEAPALRERNWADLETVLRMGGVFDGDARFIAPYTFAVTPPEGMDPFEVLFVTGSGVALRERPIRFGGALGWLDHDIVRQLDWVAGTPYVQVETGSGTKGFVHRDYLRALMDYRAIFERREGAWKLVAFIAGD
jgi:hypothetical protein